MKTKNKREIMSLMCRTSAATKRKPEKKNQALRDFEPMISAILGLVTIRLIMGITVVSKKSPNRWNSPKPQENTPEVV